MCQRVAQNSPFLGFHLKRSPMAPRRNSPFLEETAQKLREDLPFTSGIHLKTIPADFLALIEQGGWFASRISINIELPALVGLPKLRNARWNGKAWTFTVGVSR
jgi:hypothetical protein